MDHEQPKTPGLRWRARRKGPPAAYWVATEDAIAAGYLPKSVRLHYDNDAERAARCQVLQSQMLMWVSGQRGDQVIFDGTFATLITRYQTDPESTYKRLKPGSVHPYSIYSRKLKDHIGARRINECDGRDVQRWFKVWAGVEDLRDPKVRIPRARAALSVLKAAIAFGVICRLPGCAEFAVILENLEFPSNKARKFVATAAEIEAARAAAHAAGAPERALAYALQYETTLRQWDVIGQWVPLSDYRPSLVICGDKKWIGLTWAMVDQHMILRITHSKTEETSGESGAYDLSACPMVMDEIAKGPAERSGPLIVNPKTGLPYEYDHFKTGWKADFKAAGLPEKMWNRDFKASGVTEGSKSGAQRDDIRKGAGHVDERMVAEVYDRDRVEAHRRVMAARTAGRKNGGGT